ncbi:MAG TPA: DUF3014 domain-containing protein [Ramlibacter sp.]|nr:DUF3014 domain-containing protein [Ramlibacter sp.]
MNKGFQALALFAMAAAVVVGLTLWRMGLMPGARDDAARVLVPENPWASASAPVEHLEPAILHPLAPTEAHTLGPAEVGRALVNLLGKDAVDTFLRIDEFPRRVVATIDGLGRTHAPHLAWPVEPAPDRFLVDSVDEAPAIAADNGARYTPFVLLAESVNAVRAVDLYVRMYPLLQQAYEDLGFPRSYFNDRLVAVIDLLLETPVVEYPVMLQLTQVKGPIPSLRPWVRYEFADPQLESLASGQKMLLRMGPVNQRRLQARLADLRAELVKRAPRR